MMKLAKTITLTLPLLVLASCGSDKGSTAASGGTTTADATTTSAQFIDAPVVGLNYSSTSSSGVTGSSGSFTCTLGELVTFKLGTDLEIGKAACGKKIFLSNLDSKANQYKIGAILQSFGASGSEITIPVSVRTAAVATHLGGTAIGSITDGTITTFATNMNNALGLSLSAVTLANAQTHIESSMATYQTYSTSLQEALEAIAWYASADGGSDPARYNSAEDIHIQKNVDDDCEIDFYMSLYGKYESVSGSLKQKFYVLAYTENGSHVAINGTNGELVTDEIFSSIFSTTQSGVTYAGNISAYLDISNRKLKGKMIYTVSAGGQSKSCTATLNETVTVD